VASAGAANVRFVRIWQAGPGLQRAVKKKASTTAEGPARHARAVAESLIDAR